MRRRDMHAQFGNVQWYSWFLYSGILLRKYRKLHGCDPGHLRRSKLQRFQALCRGGLRQWRLQVYERWRLRQQRLQQLRQLRHTVLLCEFGLRRH